MMFGGPRAFQALCNLIGAQKIANRKGDANDDVESFRNIDRIEGGDGVYGAEGAADNFTNEENRDGNKTAHFVFGDEGHRLHFVACKCLSPEEGEKDTARELEGQVGRNEELRKGDGHRSKGDEWVHNRV